MNMTVKLINSSDEPVPILEVCDVPLPQTDIVRADFEMMHRLY
jgi:hypothetical protein